MRPVEVAGLPGLETAGTGLFSLLRMAFPEAVSIEQTMDAVPDWKGAYLPAFRLAGSVELQSPAIASVGTGWYLYAGSAYGPGGIRARPQRHFLRDKKVHWHGDTLTKGVERINALALNQGSECDIIVRLEGTGAFDMPVPGFGSSDCRTCRSHLLKHRP